MLEIGQEGWRFDLDVGGGDCGVSGLDPGLEELLCPPHVAQPEVELSIACLRVSAVVVLPEPGATADHDHDNSNNRSEREDKRGEGGVT